MAQGESAQSEREDKITRVPTNRWDILPVQARSAVSPSWSDLEMQIHNKNLYGLNSPFNKHVI